MFSTFTTGLSGLMKVAQEKMVITTAEEAGGDSSPEKTAAQPTADDLKSSALAEDAATVVDEAPASSETSPKKAIDESEDGAAKEEENTGIEGENILGAAKEWGNFLFGGVKDVTMKVTSGAANATEAFSSGAQMLKKTVEENTILGDFNRQQEKFMEDQKETNAAQEAALPPWMGYAEDEENLKEQILALSSDERHFMRPPPGGVSYQFDYGTSYPIALATLEADPMLRDMRFKLVPKKIKEEDFWRNYFYRVSLIKQSVALHSMSNEEEAAAAAAAAAADAAGGGIDASETTQANDGETTLAKASDATVEETGEAATEEEEIPEWEKELQRELQEYEVVGEAEGTNEVSGDPEASEEWQEEIQKMLEQANVDESPLS